MRLPGRVTVQVVGWQLAFETPKRNASHVVYRTVIISGSSFHEQLIRYRDFRRFHRQSKGFWKRVVETKFPSLTWMRKKASTDFIIKRQFMLNAYFEELCRTELPPRAQKALIRLLRLDGSTKEASGELPREAFVGPSNDSRQVTSAITATVIKEDATCEPSSQDESNAAKFEKPESPDFSPESGSHSISIDPFVSSTKDCNDPQSIYLPTQKKDLNEGSSRRRSSFLASPSSRVFVNGSIALLSSIKNLFGRANELETYALDYVR